MRCRRASCAAGHRSCSCPACRRAGRKGEGLVMVDAAADVLGHGAEHGVGEKGGEGAIGDGAHRQGVAAVGADDPVGDVQLVLFRRPAPERLPGSCRMFPGPGRCCWPIPSRFPPRSPGRLTVSVSLGLRPVDSIRVQVARAPFLLTRTSRFFTAALIRSRRLGLTRAFSFLSIMAFQFPGNSFFAPFIKREIISHRGYKINPRLPGAVSGRDGLTKAAE